MKRKSSLVLQLSIVLALGCFGATGLDQLAEAQPTLPLRQPQINPTALQMKRTELSTQFRDLKPNDLDQITKVNRVKQLLAKPGSEAQVTGFGSSVKITPRDGFIEGKGKLRLSLGVLGVDYENVNAVIASVKDVSNSNPVNCIFKPSAPGKYLVDIAIHSAYNEAVNYSIVAEGTYGQNRVNLSMSIPDSLGHLTFIYEVLDTNWSTVYVHADKQWVFYSCEISLIK